MCHRTLEHNPAVVARKMEPHIPSPLAPGNPPPNRPRHCGRMYISIKDHHLIKREGGEEPEGP